MNYTFGEDILSVENVSLSIEGKLILRDINLKIKDIIRPNCTTGQIIGFLGPSGRGKTQLFKILAGLTTHDSLSRTLTGEVLLGPERTPVKAGDVGVVAQNYPLFEHRTVYSNLEMVIRDKKVAKEKIEYYLNKFKMYEHKDKYPAVLSGGQRQRIAIIQQLLCSEYFILLDEPFSGLDPIMTSQTCEMIQEVANMHEKNTIIIVSHDIPSTVSISNILWLLGYDYDENGKPIEGARVKFEENLMDRGICWKENLINTPEFFSFVKDIRNTFNNL